MCKISVIIPAYNVEDYIDKSFESLLNQTFEAFEIIAINDGSQDQTLEKMKVYEAKDTRIRVIDKINEGVGATRNLGLSLACGEYVIFVDPDDYVHEDFLKSLYKRAIETKANVIICNYYECYENSNDLVEMKIPIESNSLLSIKENKDLLFKITPAPWNKLIKTSVLKDNHIMFPLDYRSEDLTFTLKLLAKCETLAIESQLLYYYLANRMNNVSSANDERILHTILALQEIMKSYQEWNLKQQYACELEMLMIKQIQYELHKVIYISDKKMAYEIIDKFYDFLKLNVGNWRNNKYYQSIKRELSLVDKYRYWIYESPKRLKFYYRIRQLKKD